MEILHSWNSSMLVGDRPYERYLTDSTDLSGFCPPSIRDLDRILRDRQNYGANCMDRSCLVKGLRASHERRGAPSSTIQAVEKLRDENVFLIVTGQQPGLLGGPLFTFYKIQHAVSLAKRLSKERNEVFLPAFWDASEDHDFPEIATYRWLTKEKEIASFTWPGRAEIRRPYNRIPMSECPLEELLHQITRSIHPSEFAESEMQKIRESAQHSETYPDFFDRLIWQLFPDEGLIILRPDDLSMREWAKPIFEREIRDPLSSTLSVERMGERLQKQGLSPQIHKRADRTSFFLIEGDQRLPVFIDGQGFRLDSGMSLSQDELLKRLASDPQSFSPSAILRPVIQDAILPVALAILGPSEIAYHFLIRDIYDKHKVPRPGLVPRIGMSLIDGREIQLFERYGIQPHDLKEHPAALLKRIVREQSALDWDREKLSVESSLVSLFDHWKQQAERIDPTLVNVLEKNYSRIRKEMEQSEALLVRRIGEKNQQVLKHIESLRNSIYPEQLLQERQFGIFSFLFKFGPGLLSGLKQWTDTLEDGVHAYILIP